MGIAPAPRGAPQIEVTFDMDANGILSVSARDKVSGKEQAIKVTPSTGLSHEEIDRMILEAKQFSEKDKKAKEIIELNGRVKAQMAAIARSYSEFGWLLETSDREALKGAIQSAKNLPPEEDNIGILNELLAKLEDSSSKLAAAMFSGPGSPGLRVQGWPDKESTESDVQELLKSALADVKSRTP